MNSILTESIQKNKGFKRIIGSFKGNNPGPTLVFIGGIHGNEPSGVIALNEVLQELQGKKKQFSGNLIALAGNLQALQKGIRFQETDLNRLFTTKNVVEIRNGKLPNSLEGIEQIALLNEIDHILKHENGPFYFFDLHTTSSNTIPFLTVNDSLLNRKFTKNYPLPIILGIEEYLEGPLLSYINELGYVAFGFEGGQHQDPQAIENHKAFIYTSLLLTGALPKNDEIIVQAIKKLQRSNNQNHLFYEIIYRHQIENESGFKMIGNYQNFQKIVTHENLAKIKGKIIKAPYSGYVFMPLYQGKGNDGFFIIRKIPKVFLALSKWLRNVKLDHFLVWLPGVNWQNKNREALVINLTVARFFTKQFFHLLGYRSMKKDSKYLVMKNRERASKKEVYQSAHWYNK